ncbi:MAG: type II toxin-antitoxin system RelE/ParE family toxin [Candidatus Aenigmarchaeota archaeon]|nr:type II toxin-antitoxin system RelE/ParE family toxin [Candidatus Aenigmarchaeota archaeon]
MARFNVLLSKTAVKELNNLDKKTQEKIRLSLRELETDPFQPRPKADIKKLHKMSKHQFYRLRSGNYRAIYAIENTSVKVTRIIPRGKGYEWLD